jgi:hypothetical protein
MVTPFHGDNTGSNPVGDKIEILIADPSELAAIGIPSQSLARRVGQADREFA